MDVEIVGKLLSTLPADDDHPYRTGPWQPQTTEFKADNLEVVFGEVPKDLDGVYLRNTENPLHPSMKAYHPFDGDGMIHIVAFATESRSTATDSYVPTAWRPSRTPALRCGPGLPSLPNSVAPRAARVRAPV